MRPDLPAEPITVLDDRSIARPPRYLTPAQRRELLELAERLASQVRPEPKP